MQEEQKTHQLFRKQNFIYCEVPETANTFSGVQQTGAISLTRRTVSQKQCLQYSGELLSHGGTGCKAHTFPPVPASTTSGEGAVSSDLYFLTALKLHLVDFKLESTLLHLGTLKQKV